jgi:transposase
MYSRETRVLLRHYLEQGVGKTELAQRFRVSRRTVYHWIQTEQLDRDLDNKVVSYTPRPPVARKLDPYRGIIQEWFRAIRALQRSGLRGDSSGRRMRTTVDIEDLAQETYLRF